MKPRILMASSLHPWNDVRVYHKEALSLAKIAHVRLIAVQANGAIQRRDASIEVEYLPGKWLRDGSGTTIGTRLGRIAIIMRRVLGEKYEIFHFHDPELIPVGWIAKARGKKVIYDVHEDYKSAWSSREWVPWPVAWLLGAVGRTFEQLSLHVFDRFILAEPSYNSLFNSERCLVVQNYHLATRLSDPAPRPSHQPLKLVYAGGLTSARGVSDVIEAVRHLRQEGHNVTLDLFGNSMSSDILAQIGRVPSNSWLSYHGYVPYPQLMDQLSEYHVGLSPLRDYPNYSRSMPTKMLDYMAAGLAVVASNLPRTAEIAMDTAGVIMHEPSNMVEIRQCIRALMDEPTRLKLAHSGSRSIIRYRWGSQEEILLSMYRDLLN
ncbi:MAG: glycosyltransferase [Candidatus Marinimicrobia bacterium]|nr:glycosyltransferase [Candidatus Neomarinimicrobiota bacterium]